MPRPLSTAPVRILVVEDDSAIRLGLEDTLRAKGYQVSSTASGKEAIERAGRDGFDLVLLDLMLPDAEGFDVCRRLKARRPDLAVIMLTARSAELDRVRGLEIGADDYITKPFSLMELLARVQAVLRRVRPTGGAGVQSGQLTLGDVTVDFRRHETRRKGKPVDLPDRAYLVLEALARRPGEVVSREQLLEEAWGYDRNLNTRTVDNHVVRLRQAIEVDPEHPRFLLTVYGTGYRLIVPDA
jgi:DNA-binding response OmpR family regulator